MFLLPSIPPPSQVGTDRILLILQMGEEKELVPLFLSAAQANNLGWEEETGNWVSDPPPHRTWQPYSQLIPLHLEIGF